MPPKAKTEKPKKEGLEIYSRQELIEYVRLYNLATHITGYHKMSKPKLIEAIKSKFTIDSSGKIQLRPDLTTTSVKKSTKVMKQQKKKLEDLSEIELVKLLGSLRGDKDKLLDEIKELQEDIKIQLDEDEPDKKLIEEYRKDIANKEPQIKVLKEEINKVIDLIKAVRARDEPKEREQKKKDNDKKKILALMTKKV